jgi:hypothetical protein
MILEHGVDGRRFTTTSEAITFVRERIQHCEKQLYSAISDAMLDEDLQKNSDVQRWLAALPYAVSAVPWWSQIVSQCMSEFSIFSFS